LTVYVGHELVESVKEITAVVWPGSSFRVVLHAERWDFEAADAFDCLVVEVDMGDLDAVDRVVGHTEVVILACDLDGAVSQVADGVVAAMVTERKLEGR
jgi:hypothetical protein